MTDPDSNSANQAPGGTIDRQRLDVDRGVTGDKIPFPDPAAAPLGTDEEAAGAKAVADRGAKAPRASAQGDAAAKTITGEPHHKAHRYWMPAGMLLLAMTAVIIAATA